MDAHIKKCFVSELVTSTFCGVNAGEGIKLALHLETMEAGTVKTAGDHLKDPFLALSSPKIKHQLANFPGDLHLHLHEDSSYVNTTNILSERDKVDSVCHVTELVTDEHNSTGNKVVGAIGPSNNENAFAIASNLNRKIVITDETTVDTQKSSDNADDAINGIEKLNLTTTLLNAHFVSNLCCADQHSLICTSEHPKDIPFQTANRHSLRVRNDTGIDGVNCAASHIKDELVALICDVPNPTQSFVQRSGVVVIANRSV